MKKFLTLLLILFISLSLTGCQNKKGTINEVKDLEVPTFEIKVCGAKITNVDLVSLPLYSIETDTVNSQGTKHNSVYAGYKLKDVLTVAQVNADGKTAIITCVDGYEFAYEADLNDESILLAITKDGEAFKTSPWFAPCSSETTGDFAQDLAKIEISDVTSPLADNTEKETKDEVEEIAFPQDPISEDKTNKINFGDFSFMINGKNITNADLDGLKIFRNTVVTKNSKDVVSQSKYSGYVLKDVLAKLNISATSVKAIASDGYESELSKELIDNDLTIIAIEKDKETGKDGTIWLAPCSENTSGAYAREVVELIVE